MIREKFLVATMGTALLVSGCAESEPLPAHVEAARVEYISELGCANEGLKISVKDISSLANTYEGIAPGDQVAYSTKGGDIVLDDDTASVAGNGEFGARGVVLHEMFHACAAEFNDFDRTYEISGGNGVTGAVGFNAYLNDTTIAEDDYVGYAEEGVAEWVSANTFAQYTPSQNLSYLAVGALTELLASRSNVRVETVVRLHEKSDLIGFIGLLTDTKPEGVTDTQVSNFLAMYERAALEYLVPYDHELDQKGF